MDHDLLIRAYKAAQKGQNYAFATIVESTKKGTPQKQGAKMVVLEDGSAYGTIGGGRNEKAAQKECLQAIKTGQTALVEYEFYGGPDQSVCGGKTKVFIEPTLAQKHFILCGGGHIGLPLSVIAKMLNFKVTVLDNRKEFAKKSRFPHVNKIMLGNHVKSLARLSINSDTYIMIVTQGNEFDFQCLKSAIKSEAGYIGVISSKAKRIKFLTRLKKARISPKNLKRIHIPAGIDIGAMAPEEIAVSIAAEMVAIRNQNKIGTDKFK